MKRLVSAAGPIIAVFGVALALRLAWIAYAHPAVNLVDDAGYYDFFATSIRDGHGYVRPDGTPTAFWPVGYPAVLAAVYTLFGHSLFAAKVFNAFLGAATAGLVYLLARRWFGRKQSMGAGLIYAVWPGAIGFTSLTLSEPLFTLLFIACMYLSALAAESRGHDLLWAAAFGTVAAGAAYVRGQALALPFFAAAWLLMAGWRWERVVSYLGMAFAVVIGLSVPWLIRNTVAFGEPTFLSTNMGINLWLGHNENADGAFDFQEQLGFAGMFGNLPLDQQELAWNREGFRQAVRYMVSHPTDEVRLSVLKVAHLYADDSDAIRWNEENGAAPIFQPEERTRLRLIFDGYFYAMILLAVGGFAAGLRSRERWTGPIAATLVLWTLAHVLFFGEPRLHIPELPFLAVAGSAGLSHALAFRKATSGVTERAALEVESPVP
jgi:4-amino-4-deoxy-L-arabinose transferase-like glycosyltransferase